MQKQDAERYGKFVYALPGITAVQETTVRARLLQPELMARVVSRK